MALRLLQSGRLYVGRLIANQFPVSATYVVRLYQADITPTQNDASVLYTANEANFTGYASAIVSDWTDAADLAAVTSITSAPCVWTCGFPLAVTNVIYGYFVCLPSDLTAVLWAERFTSGPVDMDEPGNTIVLQLGMTDQSLLP
jgi:hypothetical protein